MNNDNNLIFSDIVLLELRSMTNTKSGLRYFLRFLKQKDKIGSQHFASIQKHGDNFIQNATVFENIALSLSTTFHTITYSDLKEHIEKKHNPYLKKIFTKLLPVLNKYPSQLNCEQLKLASIVLATLIKSKYLFIEDIDYSLSKFSIETIKHLLQFEANHEHKIIIMTSDNPSAWTDILTKTAYEQKNASFKIYKSENFAKLEIAV